MLWTLLLQLTSHVNGISDLRVPSHALVLRDAMDELHLTTTRQNLTGVLFGDIGAFPVVHTTVFKELEDILNVQPFVAEYIDNEDLLQACTHSKVGRRVTVEAHLDKQRC